MKKLLLTNFLLALGLMVMAQSQRVDLKKFRATKTENAKISTQKIADVPFADPPLVSPTHHQETVSFREGDGFSIPMGSSYNIFSVVSEGPNALNYHPDINTMVFCHRQNAGEEGGSGIVSFDVSTDNGATWDATNKPLTPNLMTPDGIAINGNRYPNGSIYNPPGNTDPNNAYFVGTGAGLWDDPDFGNGWGWEFVISSKFDGTTDATETYHTIPDTNAYLPMGMVYVPDGSQWYANYRREQNLEFQLFNPVIANKLTFNDATKTFDRTTVELPMNFSSGLDSFAVNPRIAFSPDGATGYVVVSGIDGDDTEEYPSIKPVIWKTTDGGDNWAKQARMAYQSLDTLISYTIPVDLDGDGTSDSLGSGSPQIPYMSQFDIAVDMNGQLHIYATMISNANVATSSDDFGSVWTGAGTSNFFHFISTGEGTGGTDWEAHFIDSWFNEDGAIADVAVDERIQVGRSPAGDYIFMTHSESTYLTEEDAYPNDFPDILASGYRVSDGYVADLKNLSLVPGTTFDEFEFLDAATTSYYHMLSPVTKEGGDNWEHELPLVYGVPTSTTDDLQPINYFYYSGVGFDEVEFHERGVPVGVTTLSPEAQSVKIFPNPTTGRFTVDLSVYNNPVQIRVLDMVGRTVQVLAQQSGQATLDLSASTNGIYNVQVQTANEIFSKKIMKLK